MGKNLFREEPRFAMTATYATRTGRPGSRSVVRSAPNISTAILNFSDWLSKQGYSKINIHARPAASTKEPT